MISSHPSKAAPLPSPVSAQTLRQSRCLDMYMDILPCHGFAIDVCARCACVCVRTRACASACMRACMRARVHALCTCVHVCTCAAVVCMVCVLCAQAHARAACVCTSACACVDTYADTCAHACARCRNHLDLGTLCRNKDGLFLFKVRRCRLILPLQHVRQPAVGHKLA